MIINTFQMCRFLCRAIFIIFSDADQIIRNSRWWTVSARWHHRIDTHGWQQIIDRLVLKMFYYHFYLGSKICLCSWGSLLLPQLHLGWHVKTRVKYWNEIWNTVRKDLRSEGHWKVGFLTYERSLVFSTQLNLLRSLGVSWNRWYTSYTHEGGRWSGGRRLLWLKFSYWKKNHSDNLGFKKWISDSL
jgi:hypothetical protein